ncbi:MAG: Gfo/Idh/MocA family protein [Candidatus Hodarchaeota archaeon]
MKVAIIGCGAIARNGHLPAFKSSPDVEVMSCADISERVARKTAKEFEIPTYFTDYKEILKDPSIDIVSICTPPQTHFDIVIEAAEAGKHILVEKPLSIRSSEAEIIAQSVKQNNVKLCVVRNYRYFTAVKEVKERIQHGSLGHVLSFNGMALTHYPVGWTRGTWHYGPDTGTLYDFGPHLVDLLLFLSEEKVKKVIAFGAHKLTRFVDHIQIALEFRDGLAATAVISWGTGTFIFDLGIHGTGGHIYLNVRNNYYHEIHGLPTPFDEIKTFLKRISGIGKGLITGEVFTGALTFYEPLIVDFIRSIKDNTTDPVSTEEAVEVIKVLEAANKSLHLKNRWVFL